MGCITLKLSVFAGRIINDSFIESCFMFYIFVGNLLRANFSHKVKK